MTTRRKYALAGLLVAASGPGIWFAQLLVTYALVPFSCRIGSTIPLYGVTAAALVGVVAVAVWAVRRAGLLGRRTARDWMRVGVAVEEGTDDRLTVAILGMALAVYFMLAVTMMGLVPVVVDRCA